MIRPLSPQETAAAREWLKLPAGADVSSNGQYVARPQGDSVVISDRTTRAERVIATPGFNPVEATVSDDGQTIAFVSQSPSDKYKTSLVRVRDGRTEVLEKAGISVHSPKLSPDGMRVYCSSIYDVVAYDDQGRHDLAKMPLCLDRVDVLPGGRILAQGTSNGWGAAPAPAYFVVDPQGSYEFMSSVPDAESLGLSVREPLRKQYEAVFGGTTPAQREKLIDEFGYQLPTYRLFSPDRKHMVFELRPHLGGPPRATEEKRGVWVIEGGRGDAVLITEPNDGKGIGQRTLNSIEWSPKSSRMALLFCAQNDEPKLVVASSDGSNVRVVPARLPSGDEKRVLKWSDDERRLAFEARDKDRVHLWCYDTATDLMFPVAADARLEGWAGDKLRVRLKDDRVIEIPPVPMDPEQGFGVIVGNPAQGGPKAPPPPMKVTDEYVEVGGVRIPRRKD